MTVYQSLFIHFVHETEIFVVESKWIVYENFN